jgi:tRNA-dihydrouridine synthase B
MPSQQSFLGRAPRSGARFFDKEKILESSLYRPVNLGSVTIPGNLFLAPVAGYSDAAFRSVCAEHGCDLAYTEMVSAEALTREHRKTLSLLEKGESEKLYAIQLFGSSPDVMARATALLEPYHPALVDINCGCPVPKITRNGAGSTLLRDPGRIEAMVRAMRGETDAPVTVKIRLGWDDASINYLETAAAAVSGGAAAVTLHARTKAQGYSGKADWSALATLKTALSVPVFGSGDVFSPEDALGMLSQTGVDGVMFARGAIGNPFIFRQTRELLCGRPIPEFSLEERVAAARRHLVLAVRYLGERTACVEFRKQVCSYTKGTQGGAGIRAAAVQAVSVSDYEEVFQAWARGA